MNGKDTMISGLRRWLQGYDGMLGGRLNVDGNPGKIGDFSIVADDIPEDVTQMMWARHRKRTFYLVRDCPFDAEDIAQNTENLNWYEDFAHWIYQCNLTGNYPSLGENITCVSVIDSSMGAIVTVVEDGRAAYRITLQVEYVERIF